MGGGERIITVMLFVDHVTLTVDKVRTFRLTSSDKRRTREGAVFITPESLHVSLDHRKAWYFHLPDEVLLWLQRKRGSAKSPPASCGRHASWAFSHNATHMAGSSENTFTSTLLFFFKAFLKTKVSSKYISVCLTTPRQCVCLSHFTWFIWNRFGITGITTADKYKQGSPGRVCFPLIKSASRTHTQNN